VARDDGRVEIYAHLKGKIFPTLCYDCQINLTITDIDVGFVTMANYKDILISCFDEKVIILVD